MDEQDVTNIFINPYYAINIDPRLLDEHPPIVTQSDWIEANLRLMDEIGAHKWLERLLAVLQGDYPVGPDDPDIPGGYRRRTMG
jgi:hypothetical protein